MKLVIAEKPSVAMALASVLGARTRKDGYVEGNGYIVSWCVGHLVGLCDASEYDEKYKKWRYEDLPIVPECWKHKILEGTKKQFGILKKLMRDSKVDEVICATDAGREGELIFRLVYEQAECQKPMKRLWISSMEEQAIKDGFASLKDGSCYDSLYQSALCRAKADWLVGINASRLFSVLYNQNLKVGRVQTPTLAMIVDRNQKIKEFTKEKYYMAHIKFDDMDAVTEHFQKKEDADRVAADCMERMCEVEKDDVKEKTVRPPKLYDLTTLQREANRMFGYTAQQTLDAVQEMYEQKLVTYPRTDSQYLTDEMGESTETLIQMLLGKMPYAEGLEYQPDVYELLDLRMGVCRMAVAGKKDFRDPVGKTLKVATKFPNIARNYYASKCRDIDIIHLNGSIELAPILGLSHVIVDIVETGTTLKENDLAVHETIVPISARLIANVASYQFKDGEISAIRDKLEEQVKNK